MSSEESFPVLRSSFRILIPLQKLPKDNQACPFSSRIRFGSIALKSSSARDRSTNPSSTHPKSGLCGSRVLFVNSAIPEVFSPKME